MLTMPKIKLEHVVSCSSEDSVHSASNLLNTDTSKKWKSKENGEPSISVIFQLEKECKISGIDVGNEYSGFVEVFVGKSSCSQADYQLILAMSSLMTPMESRSLTEFNRVRLFTYKDFAAPARDERWDRVKVVCTQPFNKHIQYGLSFIHLQTPSETKPETQPTPVTLGKFTLRPDSPDFLSPGSLFVKKDVAGPSGMKNITLAQEIRNNIAASKCKPANIKTSVTKAKPAETAQRNRNRTDLFYESDDEVANAKIDRVVEKAKQEEEKRTAKVTAVKTPRNKKTEANNGKRNNGDTPSTSNKVHKNLPDVTASNSKRKVDSPVAKTAPKKLKLATKPFDQLMSGVVFTISGIMNPERANLRTFALSMGAKYKPDWDNSCSHLICAFANTPKFQQVRGKGKIVKKSWIQDCHNQRKRLPWRRYALDRNDQGKSESEDEVFELLDDSEPEEITDKAEDTVEPARNLQYQAESSSDTDDEIENILAKQKLNEPNNNKDNGEQKNEDDAFNVDTEEENLEKNAMEVTESVPKIFKTEIFYIDNVFSESERKHLERLVTAFNGAVLSRISNLVDFVITNTESVTALQTQCPTAKCVSTQWIYECQEQQKLVPCEKFLYN